MPRRISFYLAIIGIIILAFVLGLAAGGVFSRKPIKPAVISQPRVEAPPISKEKTPSVPVKAPPALEQKPSVVTELPPVEKERISKPEFQKGMMYVSWTENGYSNANSVRAMEQMFSLGVEWAGILATWYQDRYNSLEIYAIKDKTPSDDSLISAIRKLHELKCKIMLKPHVDLVEAQDKWRGDIGFDSPADWQTWFDNYAAFILHYAEIAAQENVELFCIGTELSNATVNHPERWRDLIKKIREVYKGQLTYAANWNNEFDQIAFWDALDYAGIDSYFPLVCTIRPKTHELKSTWEEWIKAIEEWQKKINKPVVFTEIGYKSSTDSTDEPWQYVAIGELDLEVQSNCYEALLESFWDKPWFYGVYWWYWGTHPKMGGELNRGFTPQNKPAQEIIRKWYSKPLSQKSY